SQPQAFQRMYQVTGGIRANMSLSAMLPKVLDGALSLLGADFGNVQILDPATGSLRLVTQSGFDNGFIDYFASVDDSGSACGRAASQRSQVVISDVQTDPAFEPHRAIAAASGFRAVQSTPLIDSSGRMVGMLSTHFVRPHRPSSSDLQVIDLY